jgi:hypothetical protein
MNPWVPQNARIFLININLLSLKLLHLLTRSCLLVTICTAQWSLYIPHTGRYMYRTVVTIYTAQWSLYVPYSGHYIYRTMVTICTTSLTFTILRSAHTAVFICFLWISDQTAIISLYSVNWVVFITDGVCLLRGTDWILTYDSGILPPSITINVVPLTKQSRLFLSHSPF